MTTRSAAPTLINLVGQEQGKQRAADSALDGTDPAVGPKPNPHTICQDLAQHLAHELVVGLVHRHTTPDHQPASVCSSARVAASAAVTAFGRGHLQPLLAERKQAVVELLGRCLVVERPEPRTLLERLVQDGDRTLEEMCDDFARCARENKERTATLSVRQLGRWMAGSVGNARPASRRVAQRLWGHSFTRLLGPPDASTDAAAAVC